MLDVLNQQLELLTSQLGLVTAEHDQLLGDLQLLSAVGALTAERLRLNVVAFDPKAHFDAVRNQWFGETPPK